MEITVKTSDLVKELILGQGVVEKKTTIPVLSNVLIEARENTITLTATDLELGVRSSCPAVVKKPGSTTVPAKTLLDYVRLLPDVEMVLKVTENDSVNLTCGRSRTRIAGMSRENFPELVAMPAAQTKIPASVLVKAISKTIFAVANEESRYTLIGALMIIKEESFVLVSTDGHRLAYFEAKHSFEGISGEIRGLLPKKAMGELIKLVAEGGESLIVEFATDDKHWFFKCGPRMLIARKLTGQFPDYERVLPSEHKQSVILNKEELTLALRRVSQFTDERSHAVRFELNEGELRLLATGSEAGESEETIPIEYAGPKIKIGFNGYYMLDFLAVAETDTVELQLRDEESAGQLQPVGRDEYDYRYVVMPMRI